MTFNPSDEKQVRQFIETIDADFDDASVSLYDNGHRNHLGASIIGDKCPAKLWFMFRWAQKQSFATKHATHGQKMRLFQRGHREEPAIKEVLRKAGFTFETPPTDESGFPGQFKMNKHVSGHFGGSIDDIGRLPEKFNLDERILFEYKTSNTTEFRKLKKDGVKFHRPTHWAQMCTYGADLEIKYALYIAVDKNTDEVYFEFLELNWDLGQDMINKAEAIITSQERPGQIAMSPAHLYCKNMCSFTDVCHNGQAVDKNCRSCKFATPHENGQWFCHKWNNVIPNDVIPEGCLSHEGIIN